MPFLLSGRATYRELSIRGDRSSTIIPTGITIIIVIIIDHARRASIGLAGGSLTLSLSLSLCVCVCECLSSLSGVVAPVERRRAQ